MSKNPLVSIILPFYNAEKTIKRALDSISTQSFKDFECILINNNSNDSCCQIAIDRVKKIPASFILEKKSKM